MASGDYYSILGVGRNAGEAEIKAAYRKKARECHPDVNKSAGAEDKFKEATEAYDVLSDPEKRQMYDQFGRAGAPRGGFGGGGARAYTRTGAPPGGFGGHVSFEDIFGAARESGGSGFTGMGLDDILEALSGAGRRTGPRRKAQRGQDVEHSVTLDFMEAVFGTTTSVRIRRGEGHRTTSETIDVKIPPGVRDGARIRVRGKGGEGPGGSGDLYIVTKVRPHAYFRREGDDVYVDLPVSITEAALGAKIDVPTIDGLTTVTVPAGTGGARRLRLKGKGIRGKDGSPRGDQYVVVRVVPPHELSDEGRELLERFQEAEPYDPRDNAPWKQKA